MLNLAAPASVGCPTGRCPWLDQLLVTDRPSVGALMSLCEENYGHMLKLAPGLKEWRGDYCSRGRDGMDLYLEVIEQSRYTSLLRLTYFFPQIEGQEPRLTSADPDVLLRAYHDARQIEIIDLRQTALPLHNHYRSPALEAKWRANLFVGKWLIYCILRGHRFEQPDSIPDYHPGMACSHP